MPRECVVKEKPPGLAQEAHIGPRFGTSFVSEFGAARRARERDDVANIRDAGDEHEHALEAETKAFGLPHYFADLPLAKLKMLTMAFGMSMLRCLKRAILNDGGFQHD